MAQNVRTAFEDALQTELNRVQAISADQTVTEERDAAAARVAAAIIRTQLAIAELMEAQFDLAFTP